MKTLRDLEEVLGVELLSELSNISPERFHDGYLDYESATRLLFIFYVVYDLLGAYNKYGIRRWFSRRRAELNNYTPRECLSGAWEPTEGRAPAVMKLAKLLAGKGGAK